MTREKRAEVLLNFGNAAKVYNSEAILQRAVAWRLAKYCQRSSIPLGLWVDLGSGTGLLADAIETLHPGQRVLRVDGSWKMLSHRQRDSTAEIWDLNFGLPCWQTAPSLIASSFALHWLNSPEKRLEEWFLALAQGGWIAVAIPIDGSFPQWHIATDLAGLSSTALPLPKQSDLLVGIPQESIKHQSCHWFTQTMPKITSLFKPIQKIGAHTSSQAPMGVRSWRKLEKAWPRINNNGLVQMSWLIQLILLKK